MYACAQNQKQAKNRLFLQIKSGRILDILWAFLIKHAIIPLAPVGYEMIIAAMIIANSVLGASLAILIRIKAAA